MTDKQRQAQYLRFEKHYTLQQIADEMGISIGRAQQLVANVVAKNMELSFDECVKLIDSKTLFGRPRITADELNAIKKCLIKYYELSKRVK